MLILRRKEGQWVEITHRSGDRIRIRVCNIRARYPGQLDLALDDPEHNFVIQRPERLARQAEAATEPTPAPPPLTLGDGTVGMPPCPLGLPDANEIPFTGSPSAAELF